MTICCCLVTVSPSKKQPGLFFFLRLMFHLWSIYETRSSRTSTSVRKHNKYFKAVAQKPQKRMLSRRACIFTCRRAALAEPASFSFASIIPVHECQVRFAASSSAQQEMLCDSCESLRPAHTRALIVRWKAHSTECDALTLLLLGLSAINIAIMYAIMFDWIYSNHLLRSDGLYGIDDEEEDDDDDLD